MSDKTGIAWTDATWNPVRGCSRVSEGCRNCYAEAVAARFSGPGQPYEGLARRVPLKHSTQDVPRWTGKVRMVEHVLDQPLRWTRPRRIFVNSMSDLFHESIPYEQIARIFGVMLLAERHTFQVLTKRPKRMAEWFRWIGSNPVHLAETAASPKRYVVGAAASCLAILGASLSDGQARGPLFTAWIAGRLMPAPDAAIRMRWPLPNVWLGVSVEDQATADERIPLLLEAPAAVRFVSAEPLLGPVVFGLAYSERVEIDWVIVGGESGAGARPMDVAWARSIVAECRAAGVPVFVKQLGAHPFDMGTLPSERLLSDRKGADPSEWPADLRVQEFPA